MFVNVSPVDDNLDETSNSLTYATRVSTIKNDVSKNECSKETLRMKKMIDYWKEQVSRGLIAEGWKGGRAAAHISSAFKHGRLGTLLASAFINGRHPPAGRPPHPQARLRGFD